MYKISRLAIYNTFSDTSLIRPHHRFTSRHAFDGDAAEAFLLARMHEYVKSMHHTWDIFTKPSPNERFGQTQFIRKPFEGLCIKPPFIVDFTFIVGLFSKNHKPYSRISGRELCCHSDENLVTFNNAAQIGYHTHNQFLRLNTELFADCFSTTRIKKPFTIHAIVNHFDFLRSFSFKKNTAGETTHGHYLVCQTVKYPN